MERKIYHIDKKGVFIKSSTQGIDQLQSKEKGEKIFPDLSLATDIAPPNYNPNMHIAIFENNSWKLEDRKIEGKFYLKENGSQFESIFAKDSLKYTEIQPLKKYSGSSQEFKSNEWVYTFKGGTQIEAERKQELERLKIGRLQELQKLYEISKKITIQNGKTLVIDSNTPERGYFIQNLEITPNLDNFLKNQFSYFQDMKTRSLAYWQKTPDGIYGFEADSLLWAEVFSELVIRDGGTVFSKNALKKAMFQEEIENAKTKIELQNIKIEFLGNVIIDVNKEAKRIQKKNKPIPLSITSENKLKKRIYNAIEKMKDEKGQIHLIERQK